MRGLIEKCRVNGLSGQAREAVLDRLEAECRRIAKRRRKDSAIDQEARSGEPGRGQPPPLDERDGEHSREVENPAHHELLRSGQNRHGEQQQQES